MSCAAYRNRSYYEPVHLFVHVPQLRAGRSSDDEALNLTRQESEGPEGSVPGCLNGPEPNIVDFPLALQVAALIGCQLKDRRTGPLSSFQTKETPPFGRCVLPAL